MFRYEEKKRKCRAHIDGEMTIYTAAAIKEKLMGVLDDPRELEINLGSVTELDSAGVQLLMLVKRERARQQRAFGIVQHSSAVLDTFELMGLVPYFGDPVVLTRT